MVTRPSWRDLSSATLANLVRQPWAVQALRIIACFTVWIVELGLFYPSTTRCRSVLGPEAAGAPIQVSTSIRRSSEASEQTLTKPMSSPQILILADPQIITSLPHPSYSGIMSFIFFPFISLFTDRYLNRAWRALRYPKGGVKDWTATIWLGDLTDTGREHYIDQG